MPVVELRGNADLRKALRAFAPDLDKELKTETASIKINIPNWMIL